MTIEIKAPEEDTYVRIRPRSVTSPAARHNGRVGKVVGETAFESGRAVCIVKLVNEPEKKVFNGSELERITKKEYFEAALRGQD